MQISCGALDGHRHRALISTDIGGTDPDDFQSMVHLLLYADVLDIEGLLSSPYGQGRKEDILRVITCYESDYENLQTCSKDYPHPTHCVPSLSRVRSKWLPTQVFDVQQKDLNGSCSVHGATIHVPYMSWFGEVSKISRKPCTTRPTS